MKMSLFAKYRIVFLNEKIDPKIKFKLIRIYELYNSTKKLWNEKNYNKMNNIIDRYL